MIRTYRDLGVCVCCSLIQRWDVESSTSVVSNGDSTAITPEKRCATIAHRHHCPNCGQSDIRWLDTLVIDLLRICYALNMYECVAMGAV